MAGGATPCAPAALRLPVHSPAAASSAHARLRSGRPARASTRRAKSQPRRGGRIARPAAAAFRENPLSCSCRCNSAKSANATARMISSSVARAAGKSQCARKIAAVSALKVLIADEMDRNVGLVEPARDMSAPAGHLLAKLLIQPPRLGAIDGLAVIHQRDRGIDVDAIVIGDRWRDVARIAHDHDGAVGAAPAAEQRLALRRQRIGVVHFDEADRRQRPPACRIRRPARRTPTPRRPAALRHRFRHG